MKCEFCNNVFATKSNLNAHQKKAKYCLAIQGVKKQADYVCQACGKAFYGSYELRRHLLGCKQQDRMVLYKNQIDNLKKENLLLKKENEILREDKKDIQQRYDKLSLTAVKRPTVSNKTMYVNNLIKNMQPLTIKDIESTVPMLT